MTVEEAHKISKKMALILEENKATINDVDVIFQTTKSYLVVSAEYPGRCKYLFGNYIPDHANDGDRIGDE